jgi:hypothetical protein
MRAHNIPPKYRISLKPSILLEALDLNTKQTKILNGGNLTPTLLPI